MDDLDILAPQFRRASERWPEALALANHYQAVVESYEGSGHGLIAAIKSFVECVCLTILGEFGKTMPSATPSTTEMLVEALRCLGLQNTQGASKIDKLLSAHNRMADALSDIRNTGDPIAHGKDGFVDTLTVNERRAFLLISDTILALLLAALDGKEPDLQYTREPYERFVHLHERVDRLASVDANIEEDGDRQTIVVTLRTDALSDGIELRVEPSRLLYAIDRTAYVEILSTSFAAVEAAPEATVTVDTAPEAPTEVVEPTTFPAPTTVIVPKYNGELSSLRDTLAQYLESLGMVKTTEEPDNANLVDSLLATAENRMGLDWYIREDLQSAIKVALRRTLVQFGVERDRAAQVAEHLLLLFKNQTGEVAKTGSA